MKSVIDVVAKVFGLVIMAIIFLVALSTIRYWAYPYMVLSGIYWVVWVFCGCPRR